MRETENQAESEALQFRPLWVEGLGLADPPLWLFYTLLLSPAILLWLLLGVDLVAVFFPQSGVKAGLGALVPFIGSAGVVLALVGYRVLERQRQTQVALEDTEGSLPQSPVGQRLLRLERTAITVYRRHRFDGQRQSLADVKILFALFVTWGLALALFVAILSTVLKYSWVPWDWDSRTRVLSLFLAVPLLCAPSLPILRIHERTESRDGSITIETNGKRRRRITIMAMKEELDKLEEWLQRPSGDSS